MLANHRNSPNTTVAFSLCLCPVSVISRKFYFLKRTKNMDIFNIKYKEFSHEIFVSFSLSSMSENYLGVAKHIDYLIINIQHLTFNIHIHTLMEVKHCHIKCKCKAVFRNKKAKAIRNDKAKYFGKSILLTFCLLYAEHIWIFSFHICQGGAIFLKNVVWAKY